MYTYTLIMAHHNYGSKVGVYHLEQKIYIVIHWIGREQWNLLPCISYFVSTYYIFLFSYSSILIIGSEIFELF